MIYFPIIEAVKKFLREYAKPINPYYYWGGIITQGIIAASIYSFGHFNIWIISALVVLYLLWLGIGQRFFKGGDNDNHKTEN